LSIVQRAESNQRLTRQIPKVELASNKDVADVQAGSNQNVGIMHEGLAWHASYFEFRFFSRLAR